MTLFRARLMGGTMLRAPDGGEGGGGDAAPASGGLTVEQATAAIMGRGAADDAQDGGSDEGGEGAAGEGAAGEGGAGAADAGEQDDEIDAPPTEGDDAGKADEAETSEREEPEPGTAVKAPAWWTAEDQAAFAQLSPELQAIVAKQEGLRDASTARLKQEAAEARNRLDTEATALGALKARLEGVLPRAEQVFAERWPANIDWAAVADEYGADQAIRLKFQHDQEQADLAELRTSAEETAKQAHKAFVAAEFEKLKDACPELADPEKGPQRRQDVTRFLIETGVPADQVRLAGAVEYALAYDAMRFRQANAIAKGGKQPPAERGAKGAAQGQAQGQTTTQTQPPARRTVQPAAAQAQSSPQRRASETKNRFAQKPTVDNAIAAILARG